MQTELQHQWEFPPTGWTCSDDQVHVWSANLEVADSRLSDLANSLSQDELAKAKKFRFEADRRRFTAGRGLLREVLGKYVRVQPHELAFRYGAFGKPELSDPKNNSLRFNLSHSGSLALFAVSRNRELGIDVERICSLAESDEIARQFFSEKENLLLRAASADQKNIFFYRFWTRKEAIIKCCGEGFAQEEIKHLTAQFDGVLCDLLPERGYAASLAVKGPAFEMKTWRWPQ